MLVVKVITHIAVSGRASKKKGWCCAWHAAFALCMCVLLLTMCAWRTANRTIYTQLAFAHARQGSIDSGWRARGVVQAGTGPCSLLALPVGYQEDRSFLHLADASQTWSIYWPNIIPGILEPIPWPFK
jgi:hypothetical protein